VHCFIARSGQLGTLNDDLELTRRRVTLQQIRMCNPRYMKYLLRQY